MSRPEATLGILSRHIQNKYPEFEVRSARHIASGQYNDAIVVNDKWIFRFPRHELGAKNLESEFNVLQYLQGRLPLRIPNPSYVNIDIERASESFMGYPLIPGRPLTRQALMDIGPEDLMNLAAKVNEFVHDLHTLHISRQLENIVKNVNVIEQWSDMYERVQHHLFPHMRVDACLEVSHHFESFLSASSNSMFSPTLIHGDIGAGNILLDESGKEAIAVIDFGSVEIGDPASDYAAVSTIHPKMLELLIQQNPQVGQYSDRIQFYRGTFALQEALYGAESGDEDAFRAGMKKYI